MTRLATLVLAAALTVAACGSSSGTNAPTGGSQASVGTPAQAGGTGDCATTGSTTGTYQGKTTTTFCGPAQAVVTIGTAKFTLKGGTCSYNAATGFGVNIGTTVTGLTDIPADGPQYVSILQQAGSAASLAGSVGGETILIGGDSPSGGTVTVNADHKGGTATGTLLVDDTAVAITFTC